MGSQGHVAIFLLHPMASEALTLYLVLSQSIALLASDTISSMRSRIAEMEHVRFKRKSLVIQYQKAEIAQRSKIGDEGEIC